jgi:hypothetical protein
MADVNWDAPSVLSYSAGDPKGGTNFFAPLTDALKAEREPQKPGQPLRPSFFDRMRKFLSTPTGPTPGSPDDYALRYPNPNPPVPTDIGEPGLGPTPSPGPTPMSYEAPPLSLAPTVPAPGMLPYGYGSPSGYDPALFGPPTYDSRQAGGPVAPPGHALLIPVDHDPIFLS